MKVFEHKIGDVWVDNEGYLRLILRIDLVTGRIYYQTVVIPDVYNMDNLSFYDKRWCSIKRFQKVTIFMIPRVK
jgi:hypothetical protein